ncbi:MAG: hypothetical protein OJF49_004621 [Ktedonobacterales bacterium]|jgi:hypothetical protein|nr:MAG: hypothetical protein OJF49_004621 [Ktedonobacterales bacterium]
MSSTAIFELLAAISAFIAAIFIFDQHLHRPRPYKLVWTLGLLFYGIAAAAAFAGSANFWSVSEYKLWYFFGGILTAAYLGLGSFYLLGPRRVAHVLMAIAALISIYAAVRIFLYAVPSETAAKLATSTTAQVTDVKNFPVLPGDLTVVAILMNIPGALFLFGGAAWSAYAFIRKRAPGYRVLSMALLALGAVVPSLTTGLQRLGYSGGAALGEFLGALFLLGGLLISLDVFTVFRVPFTSIVLRERGQTAQAR